MDPLVANTHPFAGIKHCLNLPQSSDSPKILKRQPKAKRHSPRSPLPENSDERTFEGDQTQPEFPGREAGGEGKPT